MTGEQSSFIFIFPSRRGSISHLCIYETQVNKHLLPNKHMGSLHTAADGGFKHIYTTEFTRYSSVTHKHVQSCGVSLSGCSPNLRSQRRLTARSPGFLSRRWPAPALGGAGPLVSAVLGVFIGERNARGRDSGGVRSGFCVWDLSSSSQQQRKERRQAAFSI